MAGERRGCTGTERGWREPIADKMRPTTKQPGTGKAMRRHRDSQDEHARPSVGERTREAQLGRHRRTRIAVAEVGAVCARLERRKVPAEATAPLRREYLLGRDKHDNEEDSTEVTGGKRHEAVSS